MGKRKIVILSGAGVSAESGVPTFRDSDGLWENFKVEEVATIDALCNNTEKVFEFYNARRKSMGDVKPNDAHRAIAELEKDYNVVVITQNVDTLHEQAGSTNVIHLHGRIDRLREWDGTERFPYDVDLKVGDMGPNGEQLRPDVVLFGEDVPMMYDACAELMDMDLLIVVGTSLTVYPAASIVGFVGPSTPIIVINKESLKDSSAFMYPNVLHVEKTAVDGCKELHEMVKPLIIDFED